MNVPVTVLGETNHVKPTVSIISLTADIDVPNKLTSLI